MSLGYSNISMSLVASTLGVASTNLGLLCSKASSGGADTGKGFNSAFAIKESGYADTDGKLIAGALPLYNIWSTGAPALWRLPVNPADYVYYQLLHDSAGKYMFALGGFRGYNPSANAPSLGGYSFDSAIDSNPAEVYTAEIWVNVGEYDWATKLGADGIKLSVWDGSTPKGESAVISLSSNTDVKVIFNITQDRRYAVSKVFNVYVTLMEGEYVALGRLPVVSSIAMNITDTATPSDRVNALNINLPESVPGTFGALYNSNGQWCRDYQQDGESYFTTPIYLQSITYNSYSSVDKHLVSSLTVSSFGSKDNPLILDHIRNTGYMKFAAEDRVAWGTGGYLEITMQYDY